MYYQVIGIDKHSLVNNYINISLPTILYYENFSLITRSKSDCFGAPWCFTSEAKPRHIKPHKALLSVLQITFLLYCIKA